jgi:hypothetical protein
MSFGTAIGVIARGGEAMLCNRFKCNVGVQNFGPPYSVAEFILSILSPELSRRVKGRRAPRNDAKFQIVMLDTVIRR